MLLLRQLQLREISVPGLSRDRDQDPITENVFAVQRFAPALGCVTGTTEQESPFTDLLSVPCCWKGMTLFLWVFLGALQCFQVSMGPTGTDRTLLMKLLF